MRALPLCLFLLACGGGHLEPVGQDDGGLADAGAHDGGADAGDLDAGDPGCSVEACTTAISDCRVEYFSEGACATKVPPGSMWTVQVFIDECVQVCRALGRADLLQCIDQQGAFCRSTTDFQAIVDHVGAACPVSDAGVPMDAGASDNCYNGCHNTRNACLGGCPSTTMQDCIACDQGCIIDERVCERSCERL